MVFKRGERVAQLVPTAQVRTTLIKIDDPAVYDSSGSRSNRGGFGSTGL